MTKAPKILLVEDEASIRFLVERQFRTLGYPLTDIAFDGDDAVKKASASRFDIIFMDVKMPNMDGLSAAKVLRESGNDAVIIGMTAFFHRAECLEAGMNDFLQKPILLDQLKEALTKWLAVPLEDKAKTKVEVSNVNLRKFQQTAEYLDELKKRIDDLRRRSGL